MAVGAGFAAWRRQRSTVDRETPSVRAASSHSNTDRSGPAASRHEVLDMGAEFERRGWYVRDLGAGKHAVRCPWIHEHSSVSGDTETALFEPNIVGGRWGFKCQHDHCASRTIRDVWQLFAPMGWSRRSLGAGPTQRR